MKLHSMRWALVLCGLMLSTASYGARRIFTTLPSSDVTNMGLGEPLQYALGVLAQETGKFEVRSHNKTLPGFTPADVRATVEATQTDVIGFVYLEASRISVFMFDRDRPKEFIVNSQDLTSPPGGNLDSTYIEAKFRQAFNTVMAESEAGRFQKLPSADVNDQALNEAESVDALQRAEESRRLFRELAQLDPSPFYVGANIGMSRFSGGGSAASTVNFGAVGGYNMGPRTSMELGLDIFSYALFHAGPKYLLPIAEKLVASRIGFEVGSVLGVVTENRGFNASSIETGALVFGPGFSFDIPLLGVMLRGDARLYFGGATVFVGTYGIVYSL